MIEIWKDILNYEFAYQISNMGRVRSKDRTVLCTKSNSGKRTLKGRLLKCTVDSAGYCKVTLQDQGRNTVWKVHRLVATHFLESVEGKEYVNHIDNDKTNNEVGNLEWCTPKENTAHMHKQGRNYSATGERNPLCKLTDEQVREIRNLRGKLSQAKIGELFGVSSAHIHRIHHYLVRKSEAGA